MGTRAAGIRAAGTGLHDDRRASGPITAVVSAVVVTAAGLVLGGATSYAQTWLPGVLAPLANSSSGWTLLTAVLVWLLRRKAVLSGVLGVLAFESLVEGYVLVSSWRGYDDSEPLFLAIGVPAGVAVGVAASWLRTCNWRAAVGGGLLAGIGLGETAFTLLHRQAGAGLPYWIAIAVLSVALVVAVAAGRLRRVRLTGLLIGVTIVIAALFLGAYSAL